MILEQVPFYELHVAAGSRCEFRIRCKKVSDDFLYFSRKPSTDLYVPRYLMLAAAGARKKPMHNRSGANGEIDGAKMCCVKCYERPWAIRLLSPGRPSTRDSQDLPIVCFEATEH